MRRFLILAALLTFGLLGARQFVSAQMQAPTPTAKLVVEYDRAGPFFNGERLNIHVRSINAPPLSAIYLSFASTSLQNAKAVKKFAGPLLLNSNGTIEFPWTIIGTACYKTFDYDVVVTECPNLKSGKYRIIAEIYAPEYYSFTEPDYYKQYSPVASIQGPLFEISDSFNVSGALNQLRSEAEKSMTRDFLGLLFDHISIKLVELRLRVLRFVQIL